MMAMMLALSLMAAPGVRAQTADEKLDAFFQKYWRTFSGSVPSKPPNSAITVLIR